MQNSLEWFRCLQVEQGTRGGRPELAARGEEMWPASVRHWIKFSSASMLNNHGGSESGVAGQGLNGGLKVGELVAR
jgi:hypothetical protein